MKLPEWMHVREPIWKGAWVLFFGVLLSIPLEYKYPDIPWYPIVLLITCMLYIYWEYTYKQYDMLDLPPK